jgi:competence protein ComEA
VRLASLRFLFALILGFVFVGGAWAAVNINAADQAELETLPGIGPSKATAILQYRADHGPFKSVDELDNVSGIGPSTLASIRDLVTIGAPGSSTGTASAPATTTTTTAATPTTTAPASSGGGCPVNINTADAGSLENLPGIGASKAAAILQYRVDNGPYASCDALDNVSGIGSATLAGLRDCCVVK